MVRLPLAVEGPQDIVRVEVARRLEVLQRMELDALAQMERDCLAAVSDVPALGETWHDLGRPPLELGQAIIDRARRVEAGAGRVDRRGEILRAAFRAIDQGLGRSRARAGERNGQPKAGKGDGFHACPPDGAAFRLLQPSVAARAYPCAKTKRCIEALFTMERNGASAKAAA